MGIKGMRVLVAAAVAAHVAIGCGSKEVKTPDDRQVTEQQLQQANQMQQQFLQQGLQAQQENMKRLKEMQEAQGGQQQR